jgi:hypothetical protein
MRLLVLVLVLIVGAAYIQSARNDCQWREVEWSEWLD